MNSTTSHTDDYAPKLKPSGARATPRNTPAGLTNNAIPLKVQLSGPENFVAKVPIEVQTQSGGGNVAIKRTDGSNYPAAGDSVTNGVDLELRIEGTQASAAIDDVTLKATTDKTGSAVCGQQKLTVVWVSTMSFRGSDHQGANFTAYSAAQLNAGYTNIVGSGIKYGSPVDRIHNQEEIKLTLSPNVLISNVSWAIERDITRAAWGPGSGMLTPNYKGKSDWVSDGTAIDGFDVDLQQQTNCLSLFTVDTPGFAALPQTTGYRATYKGKFREWTEIQIGGKWYVVSDYQLWHSILHIKFINASSGWGLDTSKTNQILSGEGPLSGFAETYPEDP